jgi:hypothetical protein
MKEMELMTNAQRIAPHCTSFTKRAFEEVTKEVMAAEILRAARVAWLQKEIQGKYQ